nr:hypothetical protein [Mycobacterium genavense]
MTALAPPLFDGLEEPFEWPQPGTTNTETTTKSDVVKQNSRDRDLARPVRFVITGFPLLFGSRVTAQRDNGGGGTGQRKAG